jgi:tetratricopeptide (TPR) repeat protein
MSMDGYSPEEQKRRKLAADCMKTATQAMQKGSFDYACQMAATAVKMVPDNLLFRQTLRGCQRKLYKDNKTGASMAFLKINGVRSKIKKARTAKNWPDLDAAAEEGLMINPWDGQFNADLGEAARERGFLEVAQFAFETATHPDSAPENKEFLISLAGVYELRRDYRKAVSALEKVMKLDPLNGAVRSKIQALGASEVIDRGKYDEAENTQTVRTDLPKQGYEESVKGDAKTGSGEMLAPGENRENDLLRAIKKDPANVANYTKLADHYKREGQLVIPTMQTPRRMPSTCRRSCVNRKLKCSVVAWNAIPPTSRSNTNWLFASWRRDDTRMRFRCFSRPPKTAAWKRRCS